MNIEYFHASKFGNGAMVAEEFKKQMRAMGVSVAVHHVRDMNGKEPATADVYVFSSPGRFGRPIGRMRRFLAELELPVGTRYGILTTEILPKPDKDTGWLPAEDELAKSQRVRPLMNEVLQHKGFVKIAEEKIYVTRLKGPPEDGWQKKVQDFAADIAPAPTAVSPS